MVQISLSKGIGQIKNIAEKDLNERIIKNNVDMSIAFSEEDQITGAENRSRYRKARYEYQNNKNMIDRIEANLKMEINRIKNVIDNYGRYTKVQ